MIIYCGWQSYASVVNQEELKYVMDVTQDACKTMYETCTTRIGLNDRITGLVIN
jgi:hypothetical protein